MRTLFIIFLFAVSLSAEPVNDMTVGKWQIITHSTSKNRTHITEKEILDLKANHTLDIIILVSLKKGEHFIKDLQFKATGIWKRHTTTLVLVIQKIEVPFAKEISRTITKRSMEALAAIYQSRLTESPIRINTITLLTDKKMTIINEKGVSTSYTKYLPSPLEQK